MPAISNIVKAEHKAVARAVGCALMLGGAEDWHGLTVILSARLTPQERAAMAWAVLRSLSPDQILEITETVLPRPARSVAPLFNPLDEAAFWASIADRDQLDAYCLASFNAMAPSRQSGFP